MMVTPFYADRQRKSVQPVSKQPDTIGRCASRLKPVPLGDEYRTEVRQTESRLEIRRGLDGYNRPGAVIPSPARARCTVGSGVDCFNCHKS